jgi:hypothetical protein
MPKAQGSPLPRPAQDAGTHTDAPEQTVPAGQVAWAQGISVPAMPQLSLEQVSPTGQVSPQPPQFAGSFPNAEQIPPQQIPVPPSNAAQTIPSLAALQLRVRQTPVSAHDSPGPH